MNESSKVTKRLFIAGLFLVLSFIAFRLGSRLKPETDSPTKVLKNFIEKIEREKWEEVFDFFAKESRPTIDKTMKELYFQPFGWSATFVKKYWNSRQSFLRHESYSLTGKPLFEFLGRNNSELKRDLLSIFQATIVEEEIKNETAILRNEKGSKIDLIRENGFWKIKFKWYVKLQ